MRPGPAHPSALRSLAAAVALAIGTGGALPAQPIAAGPGALGHRPGAAPLDRWARGVVAGGEGRMGAVAPRPEAQEVEDAAFRPRWAAPDGPRQRAAPWWAPLASLLLPGAGQAVLGQTRAAAYAAVDVYTLLQYREADRDRERSAARFRTIARTDARRLAGMPADGALPDGDWAYYERLEKGCEIFGRVCTSSGAFDRVAGGEVDPEVDPDTYNGQIWALARQTYWRNPELPPAVDSPEYARALAFYRARAEQPAFLWSWRDRQLQFDQYRQTIAQANDAGRRARTALSVALANRVFSLVDAYATVRVRRFGPGGPSSLAVQLPWEPGTPRSRPRR